VKKQKNCEVIGFEEPWKYNNTVIKYTSQKSERSSFQEITITIFSFAKADGVKTKLDDSALSDSGLRA
jgi:hypothetical protein